jgi:hypothetical protein
MSIIAPIVRKLVLSNSTYIERALPVNGFIHVQLGDEVKPFDRVGDCIFSHNRIQLPKEFKPQKKNPSREFYKLGNCIGSLAGKKILAPFDGYLGKLDASNDYEFLETATKFSLLSGVWGNIEKLVPTKSVLLKCRTVDLIFVSSTPFSTSGELVVFPNPTDILEEYYLESYLKNPLGKIVYLGEFVDENIVKKALELGVSAVLAGSCTKRALDVATFHNLPMGVINGFGKMETPTHTYEFINRFSYRQVFFEGEKNVLKIPMPPDDLSVQSITQADTQAPSVKKVVRGDVVQVFQREYFGKIGMVDSVTESSIFVKFNEKDQTLVEIFVPNFFIFEV